MPIEAAVAARAGAGACSGCWIGQAATATGVRRRDMAPTKPKPVSSISQVAGSGTPAVTSDSCQFCGTRLPL